MAIPNYADNGNSNNKSDTEPLQNLDSLLDLLSELSQIERDSTVTNRKEIRQEEQVIRKQNNLLFNTKIPSKINSEEQDKLNSVVDSDTDKKEQYKQKIFTKRVYSNSDIQQDTSSDKNEIAIKQHINHLQQSIKKLALKLRDNQNQLDEVIGSVNSLLSLTVELIKLQPNSSPKAIIESMVPVIDRIIEQRSLQDLPKMAAVLANILPGAITYEMEASPQSIAKALAPEIAFSIQEQVRIDKDSISKSIGPEMGKAIKAQIELERDAMVDALYPVIGSTISKYMAEVVSSINEKIENTLSIEGFKRKIRAKLQGVSEAELILQEAIPCKVQAIFLIHKASGLVICELQSDPANRLESDLVAGMLTAIRSFANDIIAESSELDEIDYGDCKIILEVAGYCYLATVVKGEPSKKFRKRIRRTLSNLVIKYGNIFETYKGDSSTVPDSIRLLLEQLLKQEGGQQGSKKPTTLIWLIAILLGTIVVPWSIAKYKNQVANRIMQQTTIQLDAAPELSVYRLVPEIEGDKLILTGRVPSEYLRKQAEQIATKIANQSNLVLENQIVVVNVPPDPTITEGEVARVTSILNQLEGVAILSSYKDYTVTVRGFSLDRLDESLIARDFQQIPGVEKIIINLDKQLPTIKTKFYFAPESVELNEADFVSKIQHIKDLLAMYPQLNLQIIGFSDRSGPKKINENLARRRANQVKTQLISQDIQPQRLQVIVSKGLPSGVTISQPLWLSRCVEFKVFIPTNSKNVPNN